MAVKNKAEFEKKYGAAPSELQNVLIGMKGGKAVYGTEMESKDTKGENVINNTYSQNQAIMNDMFKEMGRSGGMYNPSSKDIVAAERMSPITAADRDVTKRADGKELIGAESQQAANMRESSAGDAQFLKTLAGINAQPAAPATPRPTTTQPTITSSIEPVTAPKNDNPLLGILGGLSSAQEESPAFDVAGENANFLISLNKKKSTPKQSNTEVVSVNGRDVPVHKAETMDYRPERDGVMLGVTTTSGQEPTIFGKTLGQMSPEERGLWTKKPEGIDFDEDGMLFGTAKKRSPEEEARIAKWEESELQNNPEVRGRRIKTYEEQLKGATTNDPEELRSKGYNPEGVAAAKKELERLRGMGKNTNATTEPKTQLPNPYQDRVDGLLAFGDNPADWGF
jgi:hypothetical protein